MRDWFAGNGSFIAPFGITLFALYLWSLGDQQPVTLGYAATLVGVCTVIYGAFHYLLLCFYNVLNAPDHRKQAEEQKAKDRQEFIKAVQYAQRDTNEEILSNGAEMKELLAKLLANNVEMKGHIRQLEARLEAKPSGEDD